MLQHASKQDNTTGSNTLRTADTRNTVPLIMVMLPVDKYQ